MMVAIWIIRIDEEAADKQLAALHQEDISNMQAAEDAVAEMRSRQYDDDDYDPFSLEAQIYNICGNTNTSTDDQNNYEPPPPVPDTLTSTAPTTQPQYPGHNCNNSGTATTTCL